MKIEVYVKNNVYTINCGVGSQKIRWLVEAACLKYDRNILFTTGLPKFIKLEDGSQINLNDRISDRLQDNARVWAVF
jgi:hypothetical protein